MRTVDDLVDRADSKSIAAREAVRAGPQVGDGSTLARMAAAQSMVVPRMESVGMHGEKSALSVAISRALADAQSTIVLDVLRSAPNDSTIGDVLHSLRGHGLAEAFLGLCVGALRGEVAQRRAEDRPAVAVAHFESSPDEKVAIRKQPQSRRIGTVTRDSDIAMLLRSNKQATIEELRRVIGGTQTQIRDSLKRLIDANLVEVDGQSRRTIYVWTGDD